MAMFWLAHSSCGSCTLPPLLLPAREAQLSAAASSVRACTVPPPLPVLVPALRGVERGGGERRAPHGRLTESSCEGYGSTLQTPRPLSASNALSLMALRNPSRAVVTGVGAPKCGGAGAVDLTAAAAQCEVLAVPG